MTPARGNKVKTELCLAVLSPEFSANTGTTDYGEKQTAAKC